MKQVNSHITVAKLAEEMAQAVYEDLCHHNVFYKLYHDRAATVREIAPTLRDEAVTILGQMLDRHDVSRSEKDEIFKALVLDNQLRGTSRTVKLH